MDSWESFGWVDAKPINTPMSYGKNISKFDGALLENVTVYRKLVGSFQYLTITRIDVIFAVNKLCQFMTSPIEMHWLVAKRLLRYLKGTSHFALTFSTPSVLDLVSFCHADYANCPNDCRSIGAYCVYLGDFFISKKSSKQKVVL